MPVSPRRRFFRGLLQLVLGVGGMGYMLSRRWRRAAVTFLAVLGCDGLVYLAGGEGRGLSSPSGSEEPSSFRS